MFFIKFILFLIFIAFSCLAQQNETSLPVFRKDYTYVAEQNAFYKFHNIKRKWGDALTICNNEGAELLLPTSKKELDTLLDMTDFKYIWIAAHDMYLEGEFVTLNGRLFNEGYVNWKSGEPSNSGGNENCVLTENDGEYGDVPCDHEHKSVCKRLNQNLSQNVVCETYDIEYIFFIQTESCYKFHKTPLNWFEAYRTCKGEESSLVILNSDIEANFVSQLFEKYPERSIKGNFYKTAIHIDFSDLVRHGVYVTTKGESLNDAGYDNWASDKPDNLNGNEHCGSMLRDGSLDDLDCSIRAMFVCEKNLKNIKPVDNPARLPDDK